MSAAALAAVLRHPALNRSLDASLVEAAREHGVAALLYAALHDGGSLNTQPAAVREQLMRVVRESTLVEGDAHRAALRAVDALARAGVRPLVFKGAALAYTLYSEPWMRPRADTDLLVRRGDVDTVSRVFESLGYALAVRTSGELVTNQVTYVSSGSIGRVFDVHWKIGDPQVFADLFSYDELEQDAIALPALGPGARMFCDVHALLVACAHRVAHHYDRDILIFLADIDGLARRLDEAAWDRVATLAESKQIRAVTARGLDLAARYFDTPVPATVRNRLSVDIGAEPTARYLSPRLRKVDILLSDFTRLGWRARLKLIREHLLPPPSFVLRSYGRTNRLLVPPLYLHRIIRGLSAWFRPIR